MTAFPPILQGLRVASRALVRAVGGQDAAAATCARIKRHQSFSDFGNPNGSAFMPLDAVVELEAVTRGTPGWPVVTRYLAQQTGHVLVPLPEITSTDMLDLTKAVRVHARESGEAVEKAIGCLLQPDRAGRACAIKELRDVVESALVTIALIEQMDDDA